MLVYAISDPSTLDFITLKEDIAYFSSKASMIVYRDKHTIEYEKNAKVFLKHAIGFDRVLLHSDYLLAHKLQAEGVHFKSTQFEDIVKAKKLGLFVVISTHTLEEAKMAENFGADMITLSPIFNSPNKGKAIGIDKLSEVVSSVTIPVIALGGIVTKEQIDSCERVGVIGFASIRYFSRTRLK